MLKLKSKIVTVVAGLILAGAFTNAQAYQTQTQSSAKIKKVRSEVEFTEDVKVGSTVLKSGTYQVTSNDNQELTFRRVVPDPNGGQPIIDAKVKPVVVKCTITMLDAKVRGTHLEIPDDAGAHVLKSITFDDTNVKFTIAQ